MDYFGKKEMLLLKRDINSQLMYKDRQLMFTKQIDKRHREFEK